MKPSHTRARVLFYGDDFTGASDNAAQYARHGLVTRLYFTNPGLALLKQAALECDVIGVAGTTRFRTTGRAVGAVQMLFHI